MIVLIGISLSASACCDVRLVQVEPTDKPGYVKLLLYKDEQRQTNELIQMAAGKNNLLSADRLADGFMGRLKRCLQECQQDACCDDNQVTADQDDESRWKSAQLRHINDRIKLRRHGPAIQMDVMHLTPPDDSLRRQPSDSEAACFSTETPAEETSSKLLFYLSLIHI